MNEAQRILIYAPNGRQFGRTAEQFKQLTEHWIKAGFPTTRIEFVTYDILELRKQLDSTKESLTIMAKALEHCARDSFPKQNAKLAIEAVKASGNWPLDD